MPLHQRLCTILAAVIATAPAARAAEPAAIGQAAVERMIDLNQKAFADIQAQRYGAAKYWLAEALVISETAGLENDEMTARTYVHLAAVSVIGLKNREEAVKQLALALKINPNIAITAGLEMPALKSAYLQAREQLGLPPNPDATAMAVAAPAGDVRPALADGPTSHVPGIANAKSMTSDSDPDPPARVPTPLYCPLPFEIPREQDLLVRCLTQKQQKRSSATLYYRPDASSVKYTALPMGHSPKGWLIAIIPGDEITGKSLSYYVKAQLPGSQVSLFCGRPEAPSAIIIKSVNPGDGPTPGAGAVAGQAAERNGKDWNRRAPGSLWFAFVGGTGTAYHGRNPVDSNTKQLGSTTNPVYVEAGFSPASILQLEPQIGYQLGERFSLSAMLRYQYAPQDGAAFTPGAGEHAIRTSAVAGFLRTQFIFGSSGNLQTYLSGGAGLGNSFLAVVSKRCGTTAPASCALTHSDTLHGGIVGLTAGLGLMYHFTPSVSLVMDVNEIVTAPKVMALSEFNVGFALAHDFQAPASAKRARAASRIASRK